MTQYKSDFLNILTERGFIHQCSDFDALDKKLMEGPQSAYIGFDATAKSLHIGNLTGIMMLYWFQQTGHKAITLMGGGTSKIGDPSFKDEQRNLMTDEVIEENISNIQATCFKQFLDYEGTSGVDHNRMLSFDSVKTRLERESPLSLLEFNYMVMQGYDFVELHKNYGTILQMGGSDQWGNIINGVELGRKAHQYELFALTAPLLTTPDGKKMGKTVNGAVWLNAEMLSPYDYYQYWRNVDDVMVGTLLRRFTILPMDEIKKLEALEGQEINEAKKILAFEATKICHGEQAAKDAEATAQKVFEQGGVGGDLPSIIIDAGRLSAGVSILDLLVEAGLAESKGKARKLVEQGGIKLNDNKIDSPDQNASASDMTSDGYIKLSAGKKKHALVKTA